MDRPTRQGAHPIISEFAGDPEMIELVELFVDELPARIDALQAAWSERRVQNLTRVAHQLKGACAGYGFPELGTAAAALEARLRSASESDAEKALGRVASEFKNLVDLCSRACRPGV